jgi:hypothetical protein
MFRVARVNVLDGDQKRSRPTSSGRRISRRCSQGRWGSLDLTVGPAPARDKQTI